MYLDFHAHFDSIDPVLIRTFIQNSEQNQTVTVFSGGNMGGNCYAPNEEVLRLCRKYAPWFMPAAKSTFGTTRWILERSVVSKIRA